jgi:hypothetical protein
MPKHYPKLHDRNWLVRHYAGKTVREIAVLVGCASTAVTAALKRHGIAARPSGRPRVDERLKDRAWLEAAYAERTTHSIAKELGCSQRAVFDACHELGIAMRGHGKMTRKPGTYKQLDRKGRTSLEHRRKMEDHLGRRLEPWEHVHHVNGDRGDNRLENLTVLSASDHHRLHMAETIAKGFHPNAIRERRCKACGAEYLGGNRKRCPACKG